jgi:hypothetical protein
MWKHTEVVDKNGNYPTHWNQRWYDKHTGKLVQKGLTQAARMWPTPTAITRPNEGNVRLYRKRVLSGDMTQEEAEMILGKSVWKSQGKVPAMSSGQSNQPGTTITGALNPQWAEWLMGFPPNWTEIDSED